MKKIGYILIIIVILIAVVTTPRVNKRHKSAVDKWMTQITFSGNVSDLFYPKNDKHFFLEINSVWYGFLKGADIPFEEVIHSYVKKNINEKGFWINYKNGEKYFYRTRGFIVNNDKSLWQVNSYIEKKKSEQ